MCGILGFSSSTPNPQLLRTLMEESSIRGLHATGFSFINVNSNLTHWIYKGSARVALAQIPQELFESTCVLGHFRYSTSSLEHNQPIFENDTSIAHNGVVSQADPDTWAETYGLVCKGRNDSELVLRATLAGKEPLSYFPEASLAVCQISNRRLSFYRNGKRPLWYSLNEDSIVVASTQDILKRSGLPSRVGCIPGCEYIYSAGNLSRLEITKIKEDWQKDQI